MSAAKRLSPAASLLRQSRLMAMPAPVPPPPSYFLANPDIAPHPTVQAITTPKSSHCRGNWGLKRDLPTKTKYPYMRYTALDTLEHFMTYESAGDDVITVKKWQEMDIPILKGPAIDHALLSHSYGKKETVFDSTEGSGDEKYKWRFEGPYLPDMPAGEFRRFLEKKIKPRREEFLAFVKEHKHKYAATPSGRSSYSNSPSQTVALKSAAKRTDEDDVLALRADVFLLEKLVLEFLDIPFYSRPHRTHPSGGLHYTRSSAPLRNDPTEGPHPLPKPVPGRYMNFSPATGALVGVGGIVAKATDAGRLDDTIKLHNNRSNTRKYLPVRAKLDALGRVLLDVDMVNEDGEQAGGYRQGMYSRVGDGRSGETAADVLKNMVPRNYGGLYNSAEPPKAVGFATGRTNAQPQDVMDLLRGFSR